MRIFLCFLFVLLFCAIFAFAQALPNTLSWGYGMPEPMSVELVGGELHVVWRERSNASFAVYPAVPTPDNIWKDIYVCGHDEIVLAETVHGKHTPSRQEPERFEFPEDSP